MKRFLSLLFFLFAAVAAPAQVAIDAADVTLDPQPDNYVSGANLQDFAHSTDAAFEGIWNYVGSQGWQNASQVTALADARALRRAWSGYLWSDGATTNRGQIQTPGPRGNLAGVALASWVGWMEFPTSNPSTPARIAALCSTANPGADDNRIEISLRTDGALLILAQSTTGNTRQFAWPAARATYSGQLVFVEVRLMKGTSNPVVRINGADVSASFAASVAGTPPEWLDAGLVSTLHVTGHNWPAGAAPLGCWLNAHLTNAEGEAWRISGRPPAWVSVGGSQQPVYSSNFSAGTDGWVLFSGATVNAVGGQLEITTNQNTSRASRPISALIPGRRFTLTFDITNFHVSSGTPLVSARFFGTQTTIGIPGDGSYSLTVIHTGTGVSDAIQFVQSGAGETSFSADNIRVVQLGALSLSGVQAINVLDDWTNIGGNQARLVGTVPITERRDWRIVAPSATNGNQQLLGGDLFADPTRHRIASWVINNVGANTRTVSAGNVSGGSQYGAALTVPVGRFELTPTTRFPATAAFWINSNGTDQLIHTIHGQRIGSN